MERTVDPVKEASTSSTFGEHDEHLAHLDEHLLHTWTSMEVKPSNTDALTMFQQGVAGVRGARGPWWRLQGTQHAHRARLSLPLVSHGLRGTMPLVASMADVS
ncbi:hypothetical protein SORBI_3008G099166 [Sorghum bicolor]|uniref:Uncharacterized protein n=1 Tax=Sorghum bicolor TaxID=4558 RepID=A0A1Z5R5T0_SORBI|nr:hypothetical protein SORBI_3008G099166 [Sorghum bicolor]